MNLRFNFIVATILTLLFLNSACLFSNQKGCLAKMKNGETISIGLNKTAIIKNIWEGESLRDWNIKIKVLAIKKGGAQIQVTSPTFLGEDFNESKFIKIGEFISIIQSEEITTKVELNKLAANKATFSLKVQSAPPAPELSKSFDVEITQNNSAQSPQSPDRF